MVMMIRIAETMALMRKILMRNVTRNHNLVTSTFHLLMTAMVVMVTTIGWYSDRMMKNMTKSMSVF